MHEEYAHSDVDISIPLRQYSSAMVLAPMAQGFVTKFPRAILRASILPYVCSSVGLSEDPSVLVRVVSPIILTKPTTISA